MGPGRERFGEAVRLEPDVAEAFPTAEAVNEALRFLIRAVKEIGQAHPTGKVGA